ncbi:MAG: hypothetical protein WAW17_27625 [Rhodococcus sp. (in: high G+C Gram-positive bacteria)]|uniref:hypothetical protein n=1 Tax=Rhodococcus sp. TaxID=1831 RepID=UPI003BB0D6D0
MTVSFLAAVRRPVVFPSSAGREGDRSTLHVSGYAFHVSVGNEHEFADAEQRVEL